MNVLVTALGSHSSESVILSLTRHGYRVIGCDIYPQEWMYWSMYLIENFFQVPKADSRAYVPSILEICEKENIQYVIPLTDVEVDILSEKREVFSERGITLCVASKECVKLCRNKFRWFEYLKRCTDVLCIPTFTYTEIQNAEIGADIIAKPQEGRSSENQHILKNRSQIDEIENKEAYIYQPFIKGDVFCVDIVRDGKGQFMSIARKELLRTKNGAGTTVEIQDNQQLVQIAGTVADAVNILGCMNIEFLYDGKRYYLMDINPRFSAGIGFSLCVENALIINHLRCFQGKELIVTGKHKKMILCKRYKIEDDIKEA